MKILYCTNRRNAVDYFRFIMPAEYINRTYGHTIDLKPITELKNGITGYDIVHFHANHLQSEGFRQIIKQTTARLFMDIDDYWILPKTNPYYDVHKTKDHIFYFTNRIECVTTTTKLFKKELDKHFKNVIVIPNTIDTEIMQYKPKETHSKRFRVGIIGGASHLHDIKQLKGLEKHLEKELQHDLQLVLAGFDVKGMAAPEFSIWNEYEQILTNDYKLLNHDYKNYLLKYSSQVYPLVDDMPYRRLWSKSVDEYATMYNEIDVLLAPLEYHKFNCMKSELKAIEAGTMNKPLICSNVGIYEELFKNTDNAIVIKSHSSNEWARAIKALMNVDTYQAKKDNLHEFIKKRYNIEEISKKRLLLYK